ncbi:MAG TPA: hypothetical protein VGM54_00320 [Chthoniobacter sp.]
MNRNFLATALLTAFFTSTLLAQPFDAKRELDKARKQTLPAAAKSIEENTDAKLLLEVDAKSFGNDPVAWGNLYIIANRIVGALSEVGRDQMGKDAIDHDIKRVLIAKLAEPTQDVVELKMQTLYVNTSATDKAMTLLQNVIVSALEKSLHTGHTATP